jgi:predicted small lipoprotein YifL
VISENGSHFAGGRALALAALVALSLAGCGRIGPLEPPPDANAPPPKPAPSASDAALGPQAKPRIPPIVAPQRSFFLDPLLQ